MEIKRRKKKPGVEIKRRKKKAKIKKRTEQPPLCYYCEQFWESETPDGNTIKQLAKKGLVGRICRIAGGQVTSDTFACEEGFHKTPFFYCNKFGDRISPELCIVRRHNPRKLKTFAECRECSQWLEVKRIITPEAQATVSKSISKKELAQEKYEARHKKELLLKAQRKKDVSPEVSVGPPLEIKRRKAPELPRIKRRKRRPKND